MLKVASADRVVPLSLKASSDSSVPKRLRAFERRIQLIELARELFAQHGYHHISMDDIAAAAQVTKPVLYKHFPSKLELYLSILADLSQALQLSAAQEIEAAEHSGPAPSNSYAIIKAVFDGYLKFVQDTGAAANLLFESDITRDPLLRSRLAAPNISISTLLQKALGRSWGVSPSSLETQCGGVIAMAKDAAVAMSQCREDIPARVLPNTEKLAQFAWNGFRI